MIEAELEFESPLTWIKAIVERHSAIIKIRDIRKSEEGVKDLIDFFIPPDAADGSQMEMYKLLGDRKNSMVKIDESHTTAIVDADKCAVCKTMPDWDIFLMDAHTNRNGDVIMRWLAPDEDTVSGFLERLEADGVKFKLVKKQNLSRKKEITSRQEFVVRTALDLGFFDYPKKINLEGLSKRLNVSYVTLAEILRRAEKKIISSYLKQN
ncbi:MAG: helix-turn-helix domain-containing protein [Thermoplasmataceae archaeon]